MRHSNPPLTAVGRALCGSRDDLVRQWADWITHRRTQAPGVPRSTIERQLSLLIDLLVELSGPLRRQAVQLWLDSATHYGHTAALRGLAAGEVVEEVQHLRELLIRNLSEILAALPARHAMANVLRLNGLLDRATAQAVVGYTDTLVESMLNEPGVPTSESVDVDVARRVEQLEEALGRLRDAGKGR